MKNTLDDKSIRDVYTHLCIIKPFVLNLNRDELRGYKIIFFNQAFPTWQLEMLWEYIWGDIDYETLSHVFTKQRVI